MARKNVQEECMYRRKRNRSYYVMKDNRKIMARKNTLKEGREKNLLRYKRKYVDSMARKEVNEECIDRMQ